MLDMVGYGWIWNLNYHVIGMQPACAGLKEAVKVRLPSQEMFRTDLDAVQWNWMGVCYDLHKKWTNRYAQLRIE